MTTTETTTTEARRELPKGWRWVRLGDICEIQLGKMLSPASKTGKAARPYLRNATGIATINQRVLASFPLMIPPLAVQERVARRLAEQQHSVEQAVAVLQAQYDALNSLPAALLRQAFSGEL
jgi:restriction endonuclease S subunit